MSELKSYLYCLTKPHRLSVFMDHSTHACVTHIDKGVILQRDDGEVVGHHVLPVAILDLEVAVVPVP